MTTGDRLRRLELRRAAHRAAGSAGQAATVADVDQFLDELGLPAVDLLEQDVVAGLLEHYSARLAPPATA